MSKLYTDIKNYPHGFRRSGHFSIKESDRIEKFGNLFSQLLNNEKKPETPQEQAFLKQLTGKEEVTAPEVLAWIKYQTKITESKQYFPLCSTPTDIDDVGVKKASLGGGSDDDGDADDMGVDEVDPLEDDGDDLEVEEA